MSTTSTTYKINSEVKYYFSWRNGIMPHSASGQEAQLTPQPLPPKDRVRILITKDIAFDLDKMNRITANALKKFGCPGCHSGLTLEFHTMEDFIANPKTLEVEKISGQKFNI
ncbi:hypothetical protein ACQKQA_24770 [Pseudomonas sp. NPDC089530]|uniref:hypothetical protein n=1 Tax=Pseudomonas sp. NPDC089530 TaxID=3390651 RepID=UPI003D06F890